MGIILFFHNTKSVSFFESGSTWWFTAALLTIAAISMAYFLYRISKSLFDNENEAEQVTITTLDGLIEYNNNYKASFQKIEAKHFSGNSNTKN